MCPGHCPSCVLHTHNRTVEKLLQQLLLAGLHKNMTASLRDAFVEKVTDVMDRDVFLHKHTNKQDSWRFPLTDDKKLDDVSLSNNEARTVANGLQHMIDVCVEAYPQDYNDSWSDACAKFNVSQWCILT